jgi:hypothetical protein
MGLFGTKKEKGLMWWYQLFTFISIWVGGAFGIASAWISDVGIWIFIVAVIGMAIHIALFFYDWIVDAYFPFTPYAPFYYLIKYKKIDYTPRDSIITWYSKLGLLVLSALWTVVPLVLIILNIQNGETGGVGFAFAVIQIIIAAKSCFVLLFYNMVLLGEIFFLLFYGAIYLIFCCNVCLPVPSLSSNNKHPLYYIYLGFFKVM